MTERSLGPEVYRLERALQAGASREEVSDALQQAQSSSSDQLTPLLIYRAGEYIDAERMVERRRIWFAVFCVVCVFGSIVAAFGLTTLDYMRSLVDHEDEFDKLVQAENWEEAEAFLNGLDPETASEDAFKQGRELVENALAAEELRKQEFQRLSKELQAKQVGNLDLQQVDQLNELARSEQELGIAESVAAKADEQRLMEQAARADRQTQQFEELQTEIDQFLETPSQTMNSTERQAKRFELQQKVGKFVADNQLGNPDLAAAAKQATELLKLDAEQERKRTGRDQMVDNITASVGDPRRYRQAIADFIDHWSSDPLAVELTKTGPSENQIQATLAWSDVLGHPAFQRPETVDLENSKVWRQLLSQAESLESEHPLSADVKPFQAWYEHLPQTASAIDRLQQMHRSPLLREIYVYPDPEGEIYYSEQPPSADSQRAHVVTVFSSPMLQRETKNFGLRFRDEVLPKVKLSGQSQYANRISPFIKRVSLAEFTPVAYRAINELRTFETDPKFDPIYRLILIRDMLEIAVKGSLPIRDAFGDWLQTLQTAQFRWDINWISLPSDHLDRLQFASAAERLIADVEDWDQRVSKMSAKYKSSRATRRPAPRWVGWVVKGERQYEAKLIEPADSQRLVVFAFDPESKTTKQVDIGAEYRGTSIVVTDPNAQHSGAIVCVSDRPSEATP